MTGHRSGFVALVGRPNVGKSTLINALVGEKIAIVTDKPQTTRNRIYGLYTAADCQMVLVDTPGIHRPRTRLGSFMVKTAREALAGADIVLHIVDGLAPVGPGDRFIASYLKDLTGPVILAVNKMDRLNRPRTVLALDQYAGLADYTEIVPISALKGDNLPVLLEVLTKYLPEGPLLYPADMATDRSIEFQTAELIREQVLIQTFEEVPHSVGVLIDEMLERETGGTVYIRATILVERNNHKGIIIGRQGQRLKSIGEKARIEIERLLGRKAYVDLWVKVKDDWRDRDPMLRQLGYSDK